MAEVLDSDVTTGRFTLLALADNANDAGIAWPGVALLCGKTGKGRSTVFRDLQALEQQKIITRRQRRRRNGSLTSNVYLIDRELLRLRKRPVSRAERAEIAEMEQMLLDETDPAALR